MKPCFLINGKQHRSIAITDRSLHYGDGVFETLALIDHKIEYKKLHWQRLELGLEKLQIDLPKNFYQKLECDLQKLVKLSAMAKNRAIIKVIISRGSGGRGYTVPVRPDVQRILALYAWPEYPRKNYTEGIELFLCQTRLASPCVLAGIKHLNRLEQVIARNEWQDARYAEGLVCDNQGRIIEGTMSNIFWVNKEFLYTPDVSQSGIAGVMRKKVLQWAKKTGVTSITGNFSLADIYAAEEVFVCNSILGIWPVRRIAGKKYKNKNIVPILGKHLNIARI